MKQSLNGKEMTEMFTAATDWLEKLVPDINALNVYPVPDGDCGTNMLFTMRSSLTEASRSPGGSVSAVAQAMARGALMGARGNSGVILSQIWRGLAGSLRNEASINSKNWALALSEASLTAYKALSNPVEGTILTVIKDTASAANQAVADDNDLITVFEKTVEAARSSVIRTPSLLSVLKEAGVVDAGGHGLYTLLEGALLYIKGETDGRTPQLVLKNTTVINKQEPAIIEEEAYGFCTQFLIKGETLNADSLREKLQHMGKSLIVVGDTATIRVHIHTLDPDGVKSLASTYGTLTDIDIRNMDEQHKDFLLMKKEKNRLNVAMIAVVNGDGLANVFSDLGVAAIVPGGQSMNPSTMDILQAVEAVPSDNVIILPNNKNIILTAEQVQALTKKKIQVIPTKSFPQGVTALVACVPEGDFDTNVNHMMDAYAVVKTIEVTRATRTTRLDGLEIKAGQFIGLLDDRLLAAADKADDVIINTLEQTDLTAVSIITIYFGADTKTTEAEGIGNRLRTSYPSLEVEIVNGGQPHYNYIISVE